MSIIGRNIVANFLGRGWSSIIFIIFTPIYIYLLGIEAYGLIGFFATLQATLFLFDAGLSMSLTRELARLSIMSDGRSMRNTLRTLEVIYWLLAILMFSVISLVASYIANHWLDSMLFSPEMLEIIIVLMGAALAVQFPSNLYVAGLYGMQRQVLANALSVLFVTIRFAGAALILWLYSPSIELFFIWQLSVALIQSIVTGMVLWRRLPFSDSKASFELSIVKNLFSFAAGMSGLGVVNTLFSQTDKLILSALLSLEYYGYYVIAATVAAGLFMFITPVYSALFPRLTQLVEIGERGSLRETYHLGCQAIAVITVPVFLSIAMFSNEIMNVWTSDRLIADESYLILSFLVIAVLFNGMMSLPMALQQAYGNVSLIIYLRGAALLLLLLVLLAVVPEYGVIGAAATLMLIEACYLCVGAYFVHERLMAGELGHWLFRDILIPGVAALSVVAAGRLFFSIEPYDIYGKIASVAGITVICGLAFLVAVICAPSIRSLLGNKFSGFIKRVAG